MCQFGQLAMLQTQRMSGWTGRTAACPTIGQGPERAVHVANRKHDRTVVVMHRMAAKSPKFLIAAHRAYNREVLRVDIGL